MEPLLDRDVPQATEGLQRKLMEEPVSTIAGPPPILAAPDTTVAEAVLKMKERRTGCVLVVDGEQLVGIFTERDLLLNLLGSHNLGEITLRRSMTPAPETVDAGATLRFALNKMSVGGFRHIPVVEGGRVIGLVTAKDALRFLAREALRA
jgi:CBS domain-containing protein